MRRTLVLMTLFLLAVSDSQADPRRYQPCIEKAFIEKPVIDKTPFKLTRIEKANLEKPLFERPVRAVSFQYQPEITEPEFEKSLMDQPVYDSLRCAVLLQKETRRASTAKDADSLSLIDSNKSSRSVVVGQKVKVGTLSPSSPCPCEKTEASNSPLRPSAVVSVR